MIARFYYDAININVNFHILTCFTYIIYYHYEADLLQNIAVINKLLTEPQDLTSYKKKSQKQIFPYII